MPQITSKQDFTNTFKKGDTFYWIETLKGGTPWTVRTSRINSIYYIYDRPDTRKSHDEADTRKRYLNVSHTYQTEGNNVHIAISAIGDLISSIRGVFTSREEAEAALAKRKLDLKSDPQLLPMLVQEAYSEAMGTSRQEIACMAV